MKVRWTRSAWRDLDQIEEYLSRENPVQAVATVRSIVDAAQSLRAHPRRGRLAGKGKPWRELILKPLPYLIACVITPDVVHITRIWHGAQNRARRSRK